MPFQVEPAGGLDDLGELSADVVEIAAVEPDVVLLLVELGADPVVLVLHPDLRAEAPKDLGGVLRGRGEHELDRMEDREARLTESILAGQRGKLPDVAGEHAGPLNLVEGSVVGAGDGGLDEALAEADPKLAGEDLDDVLGGERVGADEQLAEDRALGRGPRRRLDGRVGLGYLGEGGRAVRIRRMAGRGQDIGDRHPEIGRAVVRLAER